MDKKKVETLTAGVVRECEQQGFTVEEAQLLPQMIKSAVAQSVKNMKMQPQSTICPQDE